MNSKKDSNCFVYILAIYSGFAMSYSLSNTAIRPRQIVFLSLMVLMALSTYGQSSIARGDHHVKYNYRFGYPINDSISYSMLDRLGNTDSFFIIKKNFRRGDNSSSDVVYNYNKSRYTYLKGSWISYDRFGRMYYIAANIDTLTQKDVTIYSRIDTNFNVLWAYTIPGKLEQNGHIYNQTLDSSLYLMTFIKTPISDSDHNLILKINPQGDIEQVKRCSKYTKDMYIRDSFIFLQTDSGLTKCNRHLEPIKTVTGYSFPAGFEPYEGYGHITPYYSKALYSGNNHQTIYGKEWFIPIDLNYIYSINTKYFYWTNIAAYQLREDGRLELILGNDYYDEYYGFKHIIIGKDRKTIEKSRFYALPDRVDSINWVYNKQYINNVNSYRAAGGFFNDSSLYLELYQRNKINNANNIYKEDYVYIENGDYSIFPYSVDVCDEDVYIDSVPLVLRGNPIFRDASTSRDTFIHSFTATPWVYYAHDTFSYTDPGFLNAHFDLARDTFCGTPVDLISDTSLQYGQSSWTLNYLDTAYTETFLKVDTLNFPFKRAGRVEIVHIHTLYGCRDTFKDTVVYSRPSSYSIAKDTLVCSPLNYTINAKNNSFQSYLWQDGSTATSYSATDTGTYWVRKTSVCGVFTDTIRINWKTPLVTSFVFSLDSLILCAKDLPYTLNSNITGTSYTYTWSPTHTNTASRSLTGFGDYKLTVTDNCHSYIDSFRLIAKVVATPPTIPDSVSLCANTYKITKPTNLKLEELSNGVWQSKDSVILNKNQKIVFRWTDSCGAMTYDSIFDYQKASFAPLVKTARICETQAVLIENTDPNISQYEYQSTWQPSDKIALKIGDNYIRRMDNCGNTQYDTIQGYSNKQPKNIIAQDSLKLCPQALPYTLLISDTFTTYTWSNGSTSHISVLNSQNKYYVTTTDDCYIYEDSIDVQEHSIPNELALDEVYRELCKILEKTRVETKLVYPSYIWNQVSSPDFFYIADTSINMVTLFIPRQCDTLKDSMALHWLDPKLVPPQYTVDDSYCKLAEGAVKLMLTNPNDYQKYAWDLDTNILSTFVNTLSPIRFYAKNLCYERVFELPAHSCPVDPIGLPGAFSPNGDNKNDIWGLQGAKNIILHNLSVFNRWGEKVFETSNPNIGWDGTYREEPASAGMYMYQLDYEYLPHGIRKKHRGVVYLMR